MSQCPSFLRDTCLLESQPQTVRESIGLWPRHAACPSVPPAGKLMSSSNNREIQPLSPLQCLSHTLPDPPWGCDLSVPLLLLSAVPAPWAAVWCYFPICFSMSLPFSPLVLHSPYLLCHHSVMRRTPSMPSLPLSVPGAGHSLHCVTGPSQQLWNLMCVSDSAASCFDCSCCSQSRCFVVCLEVFGCVFIFGEQQGS